MYYGYGLAESTVLEWSQCDMVRRFHPRGRRLRPLTLLSHHRSQPHPPGEQGCGEPVQPDCISPRGHQSNPVTVTGKMPHPPPELYGSRALNAVFASGSMMGADSNDILSWRRFKAPEYVRITTMADQTMLATALTERFGPPTPGDGLWN